MEEDDEMTSCYVKEMRLLRKLVDASSDLVRGRNCEQFAEFCGGIEVLEKAHEKAYREHKSWLSEFDTD